MTGYADACYQRMDEDRLWREIIEANFIGQLLMTEIASPGKFTAAQTDKWHDRLTQLANDIEGHSLTTKMFQPDEKLKAKVAEAIEKARDIIQAFDRMQAKTLEKQPHT